MSATPPALLLDVSRLVWRGWAGRLPTGIDRTCLAYVAHYKASARAVLQYRGLTHILSPHVSRDLFALLLDDDQQGFRAAFLRLFARGLAGAVQKQETRGALYLNVGHTGLNTPGHSRWIARSGVRPVYFLHDLIPLIQPEYCRPGEAEKHEERLRALLASGIGVIGNSGDTLAELAAFAASRRLPIPPALVAPLGIGHVTAPPPDETPPLPGATFVMLGTIEGRKNHLLMLTLWADLARRMGSETPRLVIIGQRGWECEQAVDMLDRCEALRGHVIELGRCADDLLARHLRHARALLFPSFAEGYGLPLIEALAAGTPVIASDLAVFRELAGDIPDYLSPIDGIGWTHAILDYARIPSPRRDAQLARMTGWSPPDWDAHFSRVDAWLAKLD